MSILSKSPKTTVNTSMFQTPKTLSVSRTAKALIDQKQSYSTVDSLSIVNFQFMPSVYSPSVVTQDKILKGRALKALNLGKSRGSKDKK